MNTATPADLWPTSKTKTGQREGEDGGKRVRIREKKEEERWDSSGAEGEPKLVLVGPLLWTHLAFHVMLLKITVYTYYHIYCELQHNIGTVGLNTPTLTHVTSLWKRLCSLRPCLTLLLPDSSTSIFSGFSNSKASNFSITPERLQTNAHFG